MSTLKLRSLAVIPARLASTRLPRKVLREIAGRPMLQWIYEAAVACPLLDRVMIAADSGEVMAVCERNGWPCVLTSSELQSGSDRMHAVAQIYPADVYVNLQADEPLLRPEHVAALLEPFERDDVFVTTLKYPCSQEDAENPNAVKVVCAPDDRALYFSRARIPFDREATGAVPWRHLGLYAFRADALHRFHALAPSPLERLERLEQLRLVENHIPIHVFATLFDTIGVDTEEDLQRVEAMLKR